MTVSAADDVRLADFDYSLPEDLIAQEPVRERDRSRLMVFDRETGSVSHRLFADILELASSGDLLVLNDTRVFPCRLHAKKRGGGKAEIFLVRERDRNLWEALVKGGVGVGGRLKIASNVDADILAELDNNARLVRFQGVNDVRSILHEIGAVPLPPYIRRDATEQDRERYQTVYASEDGAVAAPTAGLHFTGLLLHQLRAKGVQFASITLHVGPGTFQPVRSERISEHRMLPEQYVISRETAGAINRAKSENRRVIAVGTTSVRTLETVASDEGIVEPRSGASHLFIYPGYRFKVVDAIITNFHLPKSTLLMLVSAFAGRKRILEAYTTAVKERYRFYSYGDAMFIV